MLNRRHFLTSGLAAGTLGLSSPVLAHRKNQRYVLPQEFMPREVQLDRGLAAGEIHVYPGEFALYWTLADDRAIRWAVGIGRGNLYHPGTFYVRAKQKWPRWRPTYAMKKRSPESYRKFAKGGIYENGQPGGIDNPLGARALYLYTASGRDTYLRIHGTNDPRTIGIEVSNGCARLVNDQVKQLYDMVPIGTKVVLNKKAGAGPAHSVIS